MSTKKKIHQIIFEADTPAGKAFDIALIWLILLSILVVSLESVETYFASFGGALYLLEWLITGLFVLEYALRIYSAGDSRKYILSFFGVIDLLAILPVFLGLIVSGAQTLVVIRAIRILRIFRLLKLSRYVGQAEILQRALSASKQKIIVFMLAVLTIVVFMGALMYLVEGRKHGFVSIPRSMYWAIVTMTTVGYGDLVPQTDLGKFFASCLMIMGYGIIAVPTGIVTSEMTLASKQQKGQRRSCNHSALPKHYNFCPDCGTELED